MKELGITKGKYELIFKNYPTEPKRICLGIGINEGVRGGTYTTMICNSILPETDAEYIKQSKQIEAEMALFADAGNTAQKCGLLPSELLQQRDELKEALINVMVVVRDCYPLLFDNEKPAVKQAEAAIKKTESSQKTEGGGE